MHRGCARMCSSARGAAARSCSGIGQGRELPRQRRQRDRRPHARRRLSEGLRHRRARRATNLRSPPCSAAPTRLRGQQGRVHRGGREQGRLPALHAQGNLRAAGDRSATPCAAGFRREEATAKLGGLEHDATRSCATSSASSSPAAAPRCHAAMVGEYLIEALAHVPDGGRVRQRVPLPQHPADQGHARLRASARAARPPTRSPPCARASARATAPSASATTSPAPSPAKATAASTCTPDRRSASRRPNRSPRRSPILTLLGLLLGRIRHLSHQRRAADHRRTRSASRTRSRRSSSSDDHIKTIAREIRQREGDDVPRPAVQLPGRPRRRAQDEGDQLHPRQRPPERRAEARRHRAHQPGSRRRVFIAPDDAVFDKNISNIEEVKARKGPVIAIGTEGDTKLDKIADDVIHIPPLPGLPLAAPHRRSRSSSSPTTSPSPSAATWTSRATSPRA